MSPAPRSPADAGYAALACMLAAACFALIALDVTRTSRSEVQAAQAGLVHARLSAAADAGLVLAVQHLTDPDAGARWESDVPHEVEYAGTRLQVRIEDEAGKVPLNTATPAQITALLESAGVDAAAAKALVSNFLDFRDPTRAGAGAAAAGRTGGFRALIELASVPGFTPDLYERLAPSVSVAGNDVPFDASVATPLALAAMDGPGRSGVRSLERARELAGESTALSTEPPKAVAGRTLTIRVTALSGSRDRVKQATLVQLTGRPDRPYLVKERVL